MKGISRSILIICIMFNILSCKFAKNVKYINENLDYFKEGEISNCKILNKIDSMNVFVYSYYSSTDTGEDCFRFNFKVYADSSSKYEGNKIKIDRFFVCNKKNEKYIELYNLQYNLEESKYNQIKNMKHYVFGYDERLLIPFEGVEDKKLYVHYFINGKEYIDELTRKEWKEWVTRV